MIKKRPVIRKEHTIKEAMRSIDESGLGISFMLDENDKMIGVLSDGDIRRAIIEGKDINSLAKEIIRTNPIFLKNGQNPDELIKNEEIKKKFPYGGFLKIPILDEENKLLDVLQIVFDNEKEIISNIKEPVQKSVNRILIIGGAGYLGSTLAKKLLKKGYFVRVLDNLLYGDDGIKELYTEKNFEFVKGDMRDIQLVSRSTKDIDAVVHLASIVGDPASSLHPQATIEINYLSTKILAEICKYNQINRFIFASSCSVYGASSGAFLLNEESALNPVSLYARSKIISEKALMDMKDENFLPTIFRMATLYGLSKRMRFDLVINLFSAKASVGEELTIFGGNQWRPFLHVADAAEAYIKCLESPIDSVGGKIFNLGSEAQNSTISEIGVKIKNLMPNTKILSSNQVIDERNYKTAFSRVEKEMEYKVEHNIDGGIMEIKKAIDNKDILDYKDKKYNNFEYLKDGKLENI